MKLFQLFVFIIAFTASTNSFADSQGRSKNHSDGGTVTDIMLEIVARPVSFAGMIVGASFFVATSPITGLLTAIRPHNTIQKTMDFIIVTPAKYTFVRSVGDWDHDLYGEWNE